MTALAHRTDTYTDLEAFVWLGFHRDASLHFRVTLPRDRDEAQRVLDVAGCYNAFDPAEAWRIIDGWRGHVMRVELARENSAALYFTFPWHQHQTIDHDPDQGAWLGPNSVPVPTSSCGAFAEQLEVELRDAGADEVSYDPQTRTLRAWWD